MEEKVEGHVAEVAAHREVEDALAGGGMSEMDLEAKFARLEGGRGGSDDKPGGKEVDDELAALKKKVRIGT
jgi:phage shock protein A